MKTDHSLKKQTEQLNFAIKDNIMEFNVKDLDQDMLKSRALKEAKRIFQKKSTRKNRTLEEIHITAMYGHAAEIYLLNNGFTDDDREFKDVISPEGEPVEVKVTEGEYYVPYVLKRCNEAFFEPWRNYPKILYIFINDKKTFDYKLYGIYEWNDSSKKFCLQSSGNVV